MVPFLLEIENAIDRGSYISRLADLVNVPSESILELLRRHVSRNSRRQNNVNSGRMIQQNTEYSRMEMLEKDLFGFFIQHPEYICWEENPLNSDRMQSPMGKSVYKILETDVMEFEDLSVSRIVDKIEDPVVRNEIVSLFGDPGLQKRLVEDEPPMLFQSIVQEFEILEMRRELNHIRNRLLEADVSHEESNKLLHRQMELSVALNSIRYLDES